MLTRLPDWEDRLGAFLLAHVHRPFVWGEWDCCLFVLDAVDAMCGTDHTAAVRGQYNDERTAADYIARRGWFTGVDCVREYAGEPYADPERSRYGDVVVMDVGAHTFPFGRLHLVGPAGQLIAPAPPRLVARRRALMRRCAAAAFPVGR